jgi:hypothetical protein
MWIGFPSTAVSESNPIPETRCNEAGSEGVGVASDGDIPG